MGYPFPSEAWTVAYRDAVNGNEKYKVAGKAWTHGSVAMIIKANPAVGVAEDTGMLLDVDSGVCRGTRYIKGAEAAELASFVIVAEYAEWKKVIQREIDPIKAMMQGRLKLTKGHLPTIIKYVESSRQLVESAALVPTEFFSMIHMAPGAAENGLASMMAQLLEQNIADDPTKKLLLTALKGRVALVAEDSDVAMTLEFDGGGLTVHSGIVGKPDLTLRATSDDLVRLSLIETLDPSRALGALARLLPNPIVAALVGWLMQQAVAKFNIHVPNPKGENVKAIVSSIRKGRLRVYGLHRHLGLMLKMGDLFSVKQDP